jgi:hypothetical protein
MSVEAGDAAGVAAGASVFVATGTEVATAVGALFCGVHADAIRIRARKRYLMRSLHSLK